MKKIKQPVFNKYATGHSMYKPFFLFGIITSCLTITFYVGLKFQIECLKDSDFLIWLSLYLVFSFVVVTILLIRDAKKILIKDSRGWNIFFYFLSTPLPLIILLGLMILSKYEKIPLSYSYKNISEFELCGNCLTSGKTVKVFYSSGGPGYNRNYDSFYHYIVVNESKNDTFNVLTTLKTEISEGDYMRIFNSKISDFTIVGQNTEILKEASKKMYIWELKFKPISKVVYDPNFEDIESNRYLTVVGELEK